MLYINAFGEWILSVWGIVGFFAPFGFVKHWEIYLFGTIHGINVGSFQSYCRTVFSFLIPAEHEAELFALYGNSFYKFFS